MSTPRKAVLVLEDGSVFKGLAIGVAGTITGEVVFNTAMTGYQEILTDPSYSHQIVTLTYPHIGNVGCNEGDEESAAVHVSGLVIRELSPIMSNWRGQLSLQDYLQQQVFGREGEATGATDQWKCHSSQSLVRPIHHFRADEPF